MLIPRLQFFLQGCGQVVLFSLIASLTEDAREIEQERIAALNKMLVHRQHVHIHIRYQDELCEA